MGLSTSKFCRDNSKEEPSTSKETVQVNDPRSPTGDLHRTPIICEKPKPYLETDIDDLPKEGWSDKPLPLRTKLLKNLKLDPRSPTVGINRTPILIEATPEPKTSEWNYDSPISTYSNNYNEYDSIIDITAPPDPSFNVSEFNESLEQPNNFDSLINQFNISELMSDEVDSQNEKNESEDEVKETPLKVSLNPSTEEAQQLMNEILATETNDFSEKFKQTSKDNSKMIKKLHSKNLSVYTGDSDDKTKPRTPLSNITSTANSPRQLTNLKKPNGRNKIMTDNGLENAASPKIHRIAEWDQDNTVII